MDIAATRKAHNISQAEIAERLGVHQTTVFRWERGELRMRPRDLMAIKVAIEQITSERTA